MNLMEIIKQQDFFKELVEEKQNGRLVNSLLFFCEDDVTLKTTLMLTALLLEFPTYELFSEKSAEVLRIESGVDLDVKVYPKNGEKLLVSDSEEIVEEAFIKPVNLPYKVFIINNFDISTAEAQNKLLKVLEEPPKNVYFLLSAKSEIKVLPTIRSRCKKIAINPFSLQQMKEICQDSLACILGGGFIGKTLSLAENEEFEQIVKFAVSLVCELKNSKQVLQFSKIFADFKSEMDLILQTLSLCLEDLIKIKCESENLCKLTPFLDKLKDVEPEYSVSAICEISKLISHFREKLEFNANLTVAIDNFLLKMLEVKYLCK